MLCVHKAHLSWHHRHLVSDQRTLWEKNVLNRCWILSWWTVSMVITDCKTVLTIIPACVNLCRAGNYGKRCWYHRGLGPFCNQVWLRKGCFLHDKMLLGGEWGGFFLRVALEGLGHRGKKGKEKRGRDASLLGSHHLQWHLGTPALLSCILPRSPPLVWILSPYTQ